MPDTQSPHDYFRLLLLTVVGQAYAAAGYTLLERPLQWAGGMFRFIKPLDVGTPNGASASPPTVFYGVMAYQLLEYTDTQWASRNPSRFKVTLSRTEQPHSTAPSKHPAALQRDLSRLVVEDFGVAILPSADYWWTFRNTEELGNALAEAGHLVVGYGMPWLDGKLTPP